MGLAFVHYEAAEPIRLPYIDKWAPNSGPPHLSGVELNEQALLYHRGHRGFGHRDALHSLKELVSA